VGRGAGRRLRHHRSDLKVQQLQKRVAFDSQNKKLKTKHKTKNKTKKGLPFDESQIFFRLPICVAACPELRARNRDGRFARSKSGSDANSNSIAGDAG